MLVVWIPIVAIDLTALTTEPPVAAAAKEPRWRNPFAVRQQLCS